MYSWHEPSRVMSVVAKLLKKHTFDDKKPLSIYIFIMEVNKDLILKLEKLSRLELSETERSAIQKDLGNILGMVDKLNELNTDGVEPLVYISEEENTLRDDEIKHQVTREEALKNAPNADGSFFRVPKMINK